MKKTIIKSVYELKVLNDGSSLYIWTHLWKGRIPLGNKDLSSHSLWNTTIEIENEFTEDETSFLENKK
jgi:hypothetical protein